MISYANLSLKYISCKHMLSYRWIDGKDVATAINECFTVQDWIVILENTLFNGNTVLVIKLVYYIVYYLIEISFSIFYVRIV